MKDTRVKNRILQLLEEKRISIHQLAIQAGVPPSTIKNILYGKSKNTGIFTIQLICDGFGITLYEFFDVPEFKEPPS